jgi:hypothetical protein
MIKEINPDAILSCQLLISKNPLYHIQSQLNCDIYYVHHGLFWLSVFEKYKYNYNEKKWKFNVICLTDREKKFIEKRITKFDVKIRSYPGNPLIKYKDKINMKHKKTILFVQSHGTIPFLDWQDKNQLNSIDNEYIKLTQNLINFAEKYDYHIYIKLKYNSSIISRSANNKHMKKIHKHPRVTMIDKNKPLNNYFFCDIIVIEGASTALLEAYYLDKNKVILAQLGENTWDVMEIQKVDQDNILPYSQNLEEFNYWLEKCELDPKYFQSEKFQKKKIEYFQFFVGTEQIQPVCPLIIQDITNDIIIKNS